MLELLVKLRESHHSVNQLELSACNTKPHHTQSYAERQHQHYDIAMDNLEFVIMALEKCTAALRELENTSSPANEREIE